MSTAEDTAAVSGEVEQRQLPRKRGHEEVQVVENETDAGGRGRPADVIATGDGVASVNEADERFKKADGRRFSGLDEGEWSGPWMFVQMADSQLGMWRRTSWDEELACLELSVKMINQLRPRPKFVAVCGDLVNEYPDTADRRRLAQPSDPVVMERQVVDFKRAMNKVDAEIPLICMCGNHDVGDLPDRAAIELYRQRFGDDFFEFRVGGSRCFVLNSSLFSAQEESRTGDKTEALEIAAEQDAWLEAIEKNTSEVNAAVSEDAWTPPGIAFSHIPPFVFEHDEPKGYFNLEPAVRKPVLRRMRKAGVKKWFCGHYHRNAGGWCEDLEVVVTAAVGTNVDTRADLEDPVDRLNIKGMDFPTFRACPSTSGLRCVCVTREHGVRHRWFTLDSVPASIDLPSASADWSGAAPAVSQSSNL